MARIKPGPDAPLSSAIDRGHQIAFGRSPTDFEQTRMLAFIDQQRTAMGADSPETIDKALIEFCHVLLCLNEFVYID